MPDLFDVRCKSCGHIGMEMTQAPAPGGPIDAYKCPECGAVQPDDPDEVRGYYVDKR